MGNGYHWNRCVHFIMDLQQSVDNRIFAIGGGSELRLSVSDLNEDYYVD